MQKLRNGVVLAFSCALPALLALGCGGRPTGLENLTPVKGKIIFPGKAVQGGNVRSLVLYPDKNQGNTTEHEPRAEIDSEGNFEVFTANRKGAPPGHYQVAVSIKKEPIRDSQNMYAKPEWLIDEKYGAPETSGLSLHVLGKAPEGGYEIKITP